MAETFKVLFFSSQVLRLKVSYFSFSTFSINFSTLTKGMMKPIFPFHHTNIRRLEVNGLGGANGCPDVKPESFG